MEQVSWNLKDLKPPGPDAPTVFSCFHCGGGSTMGYKLAGFNVLGGVEIDPKMMEVYRKNFNPKHSYLMGVQDFKNIPDSELPKELFHLDILDGSPPCSSFSMSGSREKKWGVKKKFREGQAEQVLDELFFDFIDIAKKLKPKVVVAENVKGIMIGNAMQYVKRIHKAFNDAGYHCQLYLLNAAFMGVPQRRERTFFVARRMDMDLPPIFLSFNKEPIPVSVALDGIIENEEFKFITEETKALWEKVNPGDPLSKAHPKGHRFNNIKCNPDRPANTLIASCSSRPIHWSEPRRFTTLECGRIQTFPDDYEYMGNTGNYLTGMSVPPRMMEKVALEIKKQWLSKYKLKKKR
jgi:DNA (cytosine-5)-methyltransferase 1